MKKLDVYLKYKGEMPTGIIIKIGVYFKKTFLLIICVILKETSKGGYSLSVYCWLKSNQRTFCLVFKRIQEVCPNGR